MEAITYKTFTIQEDYRNPYSNKPEFMFYPTEQGEQHDADCRDGESYSYTGNCKWADSIEEAKNHIDEIVPWKVIVEKKVDRVRHYTVTPFPWFYQALDFAEKTNGELVPNILSV